MNFSPTILPSPKAMKALCLDSRDKWLVLQSFTILIPISLFVFVIWSGLTALAACGALIIGEGFGSLQGWKDWLYSTMVFAVATASVIVTIMVFLKIYLRSQFGDSSYAGELQADLPQDGVVGICRAYLSAHALDEWLEIDPGNGRLVALMHENLYSRTFLEVTTVALDEQTTWIVVRAASVPEGRMVWLSSFHNDFGVAREEALRLLEIFSSYASKKRKRDKPPRKAVQCPSQISPAQSVPPPSMDLAVHARPRWF
jgi:hypothetical protein